MWDWLWFFSCSQDTYFGGYVTTITPKELANLHTARKQQQDPRTQADKPP
jgi:hypothetical protein